MGSRWVSLTEACEILNISLSTLRRRIESGDVESKLEDKRRLVQVSDESQMNSTVTQSVLLEQIRSENEHLRQQLTEKDKQIEGLQTQLQDTSERHDTIILQLTRQLEQSQRLLEYHDEPWYRRWFGKSHKTGN